MHEMALCENVLKAIESRSRIDGFRRVRRVRLEIGALAGVEVPAMRFGFGIVCRDSIAEGAELVIDDIPGRGWCSDCRREVALTQRYAPCPLCGGFGLRVMAGDEMRIKDIEVC
jgi:hydrogenase nickel incorporation protein HypA/HybF